MRINDRVSLDRVTGADLVAEAVRWRVGPVRARGVVAEVVEALSAAAQTPDCSDELREFVIRRCEELAASLP